MKKLIALLLALVVVLSLAACGGDPGKPVDDNEQTQSQNKTDNPNDDDTTDDNSGNNEPSDFEEIVVVDNDECVIKITGIDPDDFLGYAVKAYFENKSADKSYLFSVDSASINGVQSDPIFAVEVAAGKKANEDIIFMASDLEGYGIGDFTDIQMAFSVSDSEDWLADPVVEVSTHVYPQGADKATQFVRKAQENDRVLIDNEYITIIATGTRVDEIWGYTVDLYMVNKTDKNLTVSADDVSVNGFMMDPYFSVDVYAGVSAFETMEWIGDEFDDNGITDVEEIEFILSVYDADDWSADDYVEQTIKFSPN